MATIGLFTASLSFAVAYGWSNNNWGTVARAHATGAVIAATYWAGGASAGSFNSAVTAQGAGAATYFSAGAAYLGESAAIDYAGSYAIARIYGASNAEARRGALLAAKQGAVMAGARIGYQLMVGWAADPNPGVTDPDNTTYDPKEFPAGRKGMNVSGFNETGMCFFCQGGTGSRFINGTPGGAAVSHLVDLFNNTANFYHSGLGDTLWIKGFTIPSATLITALALMPAPLTVVPSIGVMY